MNTTEILNLLWTMLWTNCCQPATTGTSSALKNGNIYLKMALDALLVVWEEGLRLSSGHMAVTHVIKNLAT
jgi:hypothetical protein